MLISEIFTSIQGESSYAGLPCIFVRLAGCNLDCLWCDTGYAKANETGEVELLQEYSIEEIIKEVAEYKSKLITVTGGEPLMQSEASELLSSLLEIDYTVLLETNGSVLLSAVDKRVVKIVDVKCPSSGHAGSFNMENLKYLTESDEVKFVISNRVDFDFAVGFVHDHLESIEGGKILFAPVANSVDLKSLAAWIMEVGLDVRLQLQLHKYIWAGEEQGR